MTRNTAMSMVAQFLGRQNTIPVPVPFVRMLGDYESAALLAQCLYWGDRTDDPGGWFYKTHEEWADELELSADQVRRCVKTCGGMIEVKRKGIPARNYYRANRDAVAAALEDLASGRQHATTRSGETQHQDPGNPNDRTPGNPTTVHRETPRQGVRKRQDLRTEPTSEPTQNLLQNTHIPPFAADAAVQAPEKLEEQNPIEAPVTVQVSAQFPAKADQGNATSLEEVPGGAAGPVDNAVENLPVARPSVLLTRMLAVWNDHRGNLPAAEVANTGREKAAKALLRQFGSADSALAALEDATREVAQEEWWQGKGWGLDNLLPKVAQKAEAWRGRQALPVVTTSAPAPVQPSFQVGQRVSYKRDKYTVEHIAETYIDLYDEQNGSTRITFASSDFVSIRAVGP